ncbi:MAG: acyl-CoA dehydrogenase family protein [Actinobacteria bacterium]|nr:acyl-CoA dehydrogenase family protein [Actinomycetota bacterium]
MDFNYSDEQLLFKNEVIEFARNEIAPGASVRDEEAQFDENLWRKSAEFGLMGLPFPEEYGGSDASVIDTCLAGEALGYGGGDMGFALSWGAHVTIGGIPIWQFGTEDQKKKYLPGIASGEWIAGMGLTEPEAGSDAAGVTMKAEKRNGYYLLNGTKTFITNGPIGNVFVVFARTTPGSGMKGISAFIVEKDFPGFSAGKKIEKMGHRSSPTSELIFDNCEVPAENLLGVEDKAFRDIAVGTLEWEHTVMLAPYIGMMQALLEDSIQYAKQRKQFGKPIADFQAVQFKIADIKTMLETSRLMLYKVAWGRDQGVSDPMTASIAKIVVTESYMETAQQATQIFGGYGYTKEYSVERAIRDAKLTVIGGGTSEIQRWIVGRKLLDR